MYSDYTDYTNYTDYAHYADFTYSEVFTTVIRFVIFETVVMDLLP